MLHPRALLAALALAAAPAAAQEPEAPAPAAVTTADRQAIAFAEARGRLLFALDRAAWVATDDFVARVRNYRDLGVRGFVVEREGEGYAVTFYGGAGPAPVAFYRGLVRSHRVRSRQVFAAAARPALTPAQRRLVAAREAALAANRNPPCEEAPFNTAIIPPATPDGPIDVYLLTPQLRDGAWPAGGHYRVTVGVDGRVGGERAFTNSCLLMDPRNGPGGGSAAAMLVTHLLDSVPTEIHVFTALTSRVPLYVGIDDPPRLFEVSGSGIRLVHEGD
ncbi:MAG TPA: hypothetical protein VGB08_09390 [Allosphingosinicella sp.]|jgi:hypothetical protein